MRLIANKGKSPRTSSGGGGGGGEDVSTVVVEEQPPVVVRVTKPYVFQYPMNYFDSTEASDYDPHDYEGPVFLGYGTRKRPWREKKPKRKKDKNQQGDGKTLPIILPVTPRNHCSERAYTNSSSNNNNNNSGNAHSDNRSVAELDNWDKILSVVYTNDDADYDDDSGDDGSRTLGDLIQKITPPSPTGVTMIELVLTK